MSSTTTVKPSEGTFLCVHLPLRCSQNHDRQAGMRETENAILCTVCHCFLCFFTRAVRLITSTMVKMSSSLSGLCLWYVLHSPAAPSTTWAQLLSLTDTPDQLNEVQGTSITELHNVQFSPVLPAYSKVPPVLREVLDTCSCGDWLHCCDRI